MKEEQPEHQSGEGYLPVRSPQGSADLHPKYSMYSDWSQAQPNELPASQDVVEYWRIFCQHKSLILQLALLGLLLALSFGFFQRPVYRAHTSIAIQDLNENFLNLKEDPTAINSAGPAESYFQTQIQILQSESLLQRVAEKPAMAQALAQEEIQSRRIDWRKYLGLPEVASPRDSQNLVDKIASHLTVRSSGETRLVQVYFESGDPLLAADFANTLVKEFVEQSHQMRWESTQRTAEWLAAHLNEMKSNLENAETQLQAYARVSGLLFSDKGNVAEEKLRQFQEEYSKAQVDRAEKQVRYETAITKPLESLPEALDDPTFREFGLKLAALKQERAQLTSTLTPAHYRVRQVQAQIDELSSALETQRANIVRRSANEYLRARRREELLATAYDQQARTVSDQAQKAIRYDTLKHEVDTSRQLYDALLQRVKQAGLAAAMRASNILVVDPAKAPVLPYRPNYPLNAALGLLIGVFFGTGLSILRERFNRRIFVPGVAPAYLNLPELGAIPMAAIPASRLRRLFPGREKSLRTIPGVAGNMVNVNQVGKISLVKGGIAHPELAMMAEAFRATLTSILLQGLEGLPPRVIVLTSPGPGDGKTTVTSNLGITMAKIGRRVLLVDADLRNPDLHRVFQLSNSWGLCNVLRSDNPIDSRGLLQIVRHTDVPALDLLPSGTTQENPLSLLYSPRVAELLGRMRQEYDLVLIDTPPMMQLADARVLGRVADGVVLVIQSGRTTLEQARLAVQRFADDRTHMLGTVLNNWDPKSNGGNDYAESYGECARQYHD